MNHQNRSTLWLLAALTAPIAHISGTGWFPALLTALAILPLTLLPKKWEDLSKPMAILQIGWLGIVAGLLLPGSASNWPSSNTRVVPLTILALASITGPAAAPRTGTVLAYCMALLAIPIGVAASARIEPEWLAPTFRTWSSALILILLLPNLPAAGGRKRRAPYAVLLTLAITALVQGVLSPQVGASVPDPAYQTARTLGHMEPIVAAGLTLGWYALTTFLFQNATTIARSAGISRKWASVLLSATATILVLFPQQPNASFVTIMSAFLWLITPFLRKMNLFEKTEK